MATRKKARPKTPQRRTLIKTKPLAVAVHRAVMKMGNRAAKPAEKRTKE